MRLPSLFSLLVLVPFAACGGSDSKDDAASGHDAAHVDSPHIDSPHVDGHVDTVLPDANAHAAGHVVTCPATTMGTLETNGMAYQYKDAGGTVVPSLTVAVGDTIHVTTTAFHDVTPATGNDANLHVDFSLDTCVTFTGAGAFNFFCSRHGFTGSITVN